VRAHRHNVLVCGATPPLDRAATLPALLQRQGYTTALVGKFHFPEQACLQNRHVAKKGTGPDARPLGWDRCRAGQISWQWGQAVAIADSLRS
jgi:arylsulfatase A-like enzyme